MPIANSATPLQVHSSDFLAYLEQSLRNPFVLDLKGRTLMEVIGACVKAKSRIHPNYAAIMYMTSSDVVDIQTYVFLTTMLETNKI